MDAELAVGLPQPDLAGYGVRLLEPAPGPTGRRWLGEGVAAQPAALAGEDAAEDAVVAGEADGGRDRQVETLVADLTALADGLGLGGLDRLARGKRQRLGISSCPADRLAAEHPDHVWALDYQFDQTTDGRILELLNVVDEHTREALTITVDRRIDADTTVKVLDRLVVERGRHHGSSAWTMAWS